MSIFDSDAFNKNLFFPRKDNHTISKNDIFIDVDDKVKIHVKIYPHLEAIFTLLYFHGNGEIVADYEDIAPSFHEIGVELIVCDYRGYGKSSGVPTLRNILTDSHKIHSFLKENQKLKEKCIVMGRSLGSAPAIELASTIKLTACIIESGYADTINLAARRGIRIERLHEEDFIFDNGAKIKNVSCPLLLMHGKEDQIIAVEEAKENYDNATTKDKQLFLFDSVGHNNILFAKEYFPTIKNFLMILK